MRNVDLNKFIGAVVAIVFACHSAFCQRPGTIEPLIDEWNSAHNTRNIHGFERVYADRLNFYSRDLPKSEVINAKRQLFRSKPQFRQRIITEIEHISQSSDLTKCVFTTEVFENEQWKRQRMELLVRRANGRYAIVGENFVAPERTARRRQSESTTPVQPKIDADTMKKTVADTPSVAETTPVLPPMEHPDSVDSEFSEEQYYGADTINTELSFSDFEALFSDISSLGVVTIPRGYIFILIGILMIGGIMIFIADSARSSRKRRQVFTQSAHSEAEHVVRDFKVQAAFEAFVVTLFDPLFFKSFRPKAEYVYEGNTIAAERGPDLVFDYQQKDLSIRFAIVCQYYQHTAKNEVQLLSQSRQEFFKTFEAARDIDVYYVLGFGGRPDDPRELFFVPAKEVTNEYMTRAELKRFSKSGMFYYNKRTGRIQ